MWKLAIVSMLAGCLGESDPHYDDDPEPWHVKLNVTSPTAFTELMISFPMGGPLTETKSFAAATTSGLVFVQYLEAMPLVDLDSDVGEVHLHAEVVPTYTDTPNPLADQTLHEYTADVTLVESN